MCGINGILLKNYDAGIRRRIEKMNESLLHRGPDAGKVIVSGDGKTRHRAPASQHHRFKRAFHPAHGIGVRAVGIKL